MVKLTRITKEYALNAPLETLPAPATKVVRDELRELVRGTAREAEVVEWFKGWVPHHEAVALIAELRRAQGRLPTQPVEVKLKVNQTNDQLRADLDAELERARAAENRRRVYEVALHHAIEEKFAWQRQQEAWEHRYDPTGNWGPPNYKTQREDW
jgi:hypothetical protein